MDQQVYAKKGYSALMTVLIISAVSVSIILGLFLASINKSKQAIITEYSETSKALSNACAEDALYQLKINSSFTGTSSLVLGEDTCEYEIISLGSSKNIYVTSTVSGVTRNIYLTINSTNPLNIYSWSELTASDIVIINDPPGPFDLLTPANGAVDTGVSLLSFDWEDSIDPDSDTVYYRFTLNSSSTQLVNISGLTESNYSLDFDLSYSSLYTWEVIAYDSYGNETQNNGGAFNFTTQASMTNDPPGNFNLIFPWDGSITTSTSPDFDWEDSIDPDSDPITYTFYLDDNSDFSSPLVSQTGIAQSNYVLLITLSENTTYYWKVLAVDDHNNSTWSNQVFNFTVPGSLIISYYFDSNPFVQAIDWSGNSNHGTLFGGITNATGKLCRAAYFDGINDYISLNHNTSLTNLSAFTLSMWVSVPDFLISSRHLVYKENAYELYLEKSGQDYRVVGIVYLNGNPVQIQSSKIIRDTNTWYYISFVYNGSLIQIYNGINLDTNSNASGIVNTGIGSFYLGRPNFHAGYIDEFRFYSKALNTTEINNLINETRICF